MYSTPAKDLREQISRLQRAGLLKIIDCPVDPHLELAEIHRRVVAQEGPTLLFTKIRNAKFPVVSNLYGSVKHLELAFGSDCHSLIEKITTLIENAPPSLSTLWKNRRLLSRLTRLGRKKTAKAPVCEEQMKRVDLESLPMITSWPEDGGAFITLPLVLTKSPLGKSENLGMYRIQRFNKTQTGLHFQIQKGGGFHYQQAEEKNIPLEVCIFVGGSPILTLAAISPLPENISEVLFASFLLGEKIPTAFLKEEALPLFADCEFALSGISPPHERKLEGPFGDHYGYYSLAHPFPVFNCKKIYHRKNAIWPATVVGKAPQEDLYIGNYLQDLLSPLISLAMPGVKKLWTYGESGFHALAGAVVKERYEREIMRTALRILGEGQLSLTKVLLITDKDIDPKDFPLMLKTVLERIDFQKDLYILTHLCLDTLDYTGPQLNHGSRAIFLGCGKEKRTLSPSPPPLGGWADEMAMFCPGCVLVSKKNLNRTELIPWVQKLEQNLLEQWPLFILVDDVHTCSRSSSEFLWQVFMRFDPAQDVYFPQQEVIKHHIRYQGPLVIDARMKPSYPKILECDSETKSKVNKRWKEYFPKGL